MLGYLSFYLKIKKVIIFKKYEITINCIMK